MACRSEEKLRRHSLSTIISSGPPFRSITRLATKRLLKSLNYERLGKNPPRSLACSAYTRRLRDRVFSQVYRLERTFPGPVTTFTAIKRGWELTAKQLMDADLDKLRAGFLSDINRRGAPEASGWLIAFIHGEYETPSGIFRLHLHGVVSGEMIEVVDRLRSGAQYRYQPEDDVRFRLRIARRPLTNLPHSLTYCLKGYWPWKHVSTGLSGKRRTRRHKRIPEPYHALVLHFLDRHSPNDFVVLKHLHVASGQLRLFPRAIVKAGE